MLNRETIRRTYPGLSKLELTPLGRNSAHIVAGDGLAANTKINILYALGVSPTQIFQIAPGNLLAPSSFRSLGQACGPLRLEDIPEGCDREKVEERSRAHYQIMARSVLSGVVPMDSIEFGPNLTMIESGRLRPLMDDAYLVGGTYSINPFIYNRLLGRNIVVAGIERIDARVVWRDNTLLIQEANGKLTSLRDFLKIGDGRRIDMYDCSAGNIFPKEGGSKSYGTSTVLNLHNSYLGGIATPMVILGENSEHFVSINPTKARRDVVIASKSGSSVSPEDMKAIYHTGVRLIDRYNELIRQGYFPDYPQCHTLPYLFDEMFDRISYEELNTERYVDVPDYTGEGTKFYLSLGYRYILPKPILGALKVDAEGVTISQVTGFGGSGYTVIPGAVPNFVQSHLVESELAEVNSVRMYVPQASTYSPGKPFALERLFPNLELIKTADPQQFIVVGEGPHAFLMALYLKDLGHAVCVVSGRTSETNQWFEFSDLMTRQYKVGEVDIADIPERFQDEAQAVTDNTFAHLDYLSQLDTSGVTKTSAGEFVVDSEAYGKYLSYLLHISGIDNHEMPIQIAVSDQTDRIVFCHLIDEFSSAALGFEDPVIVDLTSGSNKGFTDASGHIGPLGLQEIFKKITINVSSANENSMGWTSSRTIETEEKVCKMLGYIERRVEAERFSSRRCQGDLLPPEEPGREYEGGLIKAIREALQDTSSEITELPNTVTFNMLGAEIVVKEALVLDPRIPYIGMHRLQKRVPGTPVFSIMLDLTKFGLVGVVPLAARYLGAQLGLPLKRNNEATLRDPLDSTRRAKLMPTPVSDIASGH